MISTLSTAQQNAISNFLSGKHIPSGLGSAEEACSIAAINLALYGQLTDEIPPCMSEVIGKPAIRLQDAMPDSMRNSQEWRELLPLAAGTGRDKEPERLVIIMEWMWTTVLPTLQPIADSSGFSDEWKIMLSDKTYASARAAWAAASARASARAAAAKSAAWAAAWAAAYAEEWAKAAAYAAAAAAEAAAWAKAAAYAAAYWNQINPCALLRSMIFIDNLGNDEGTK